VKHLTHDQLSARLDGEVHWRAAAEVERHLAACAECREALAELAAQEAALKPALTHEPGEAYFESFAARVEDRLRAHGLAGAQRRERPWSQGGLGWLFGTPRGLAWAGAATAVLVAGAAIVLVTGEHVQAPHLRDRLLAARGQQESAPAAPPAVSDAGARRGAAPTGEPAPDDRRAEADAGFASPPLADEMSQAKQEAIAAPQSNQRLSGGTAPSRARETRINEAGEEVPVARRERGDVPVSRVEPPPSATPAPQTTAGSLEAQRSGETPKTGAAAPQGAPSQPAREGLAEQADAVRKKLFAQPMKPAAPSEEKSLAPRDAAAPGAAAQERADLNVLSRDAAEGRLCGEVRDDRGRPVAGAQVVLADVARIATTDASGAFCIRAPVGEHPLAVLAVGFNESRQSVQIGEQESNVRVSLDPVPVMAGRTAWGTAKSFYRSGAERGSGIGTAADPFAELPDSLRDHVTAARRLSATAGARRSAAIHDAAAIRWERVVRALPAGPAGDEARRELAEARWQAWSAGATPQRAIAAIEALTAWANRAPAGAARDEALRRLRRISR
jgi:hypothetical protein